jgi:hypothetical protein
MEVERRNARPRSALLRALCTTELGGLEFLRTEPVEAPITPGPRAAPRATPFARL